MPFILTMVNEVIAAGDVHHINYGDCGLVVFLLSILTISITGVLLLNSPVRKTEAS